MYFRTPAKLNTPFIRMREGNVWGTAWWVRRERLTKRREEEKKGKDGKVFGRGQPTTRGNGQIMTKTLKGPRTDDEPR